MGRLCGLSGFKLIVVVIDWFVLILISIYGMSFFLFVYIKKYLYIKKKTISFDRKTFIYKAVLVWGDIVFFFVFKLGRKFASFCDVAKFENAEASFVQLLIKPFTDMYICGALGNRDGTKRDTASPSCHFKTGLQKLI